MCTTRAYAHFMISLYMNRWCIYDADVFDHKIMTWSVIQYRSVRVCIYIDNFRGAAHTAVYSH